MQVTASPCKSFRDTYTKVFDSRKRRVRGLWQRNGRFLANLTVADDVGAKTNRFVPLNGGSLTQGKSTCSGVAACARSTRLDGRLPA